MCDAIYCFVPLFVLLLGVFVCGALCQFPRGTKARELAYMLTAELREWRRPERAAAAPPRLGWDELLPAGFPEAAPATPGLASTAP